MIVVTEFGNAKTNPNTSGFHADVTGGRGCPSRGDETHLAVAPCNLARKTSAIGDLPEARL